MVTGDIWAVISPYVQEKAVSMWHIICLRQLTTTDSASFQSNSHVCQFHTVSVCLSLKQSSTPLHGSCRMAKAVKEEKNILLKLVMSVVNDTEQHNSLRNLNKFQ